MDKEINNSGTKECFVIMPISDQDGYETRHFDNVYEYMIKPAVEEAGLKPCRADEEKGSHLIHSTIIKKIIEAPMAICDLSSKNPNVLFELGIRQAFDKPVILISDEKTDRIFDVAGINTIQYDSHRKIENVLDAQKNIVDAINAGKEGEIINSVIKYLDMGTAKIDQTVNTEENKLDFLIQALNSLEKRFRNFTQIQTDNGRFYDERRGEELLVLKHREEELINKIVRYEQEVDMLSKKIHKMDIQNKNLRQKLIEE